MPIQTTILDSGNVVLSPDFPAKAAFSEYLDFADRLLARWHKVREEWNRSPFSAELAEQKRELDRVVGDFVQTFAVRYAAKGVEQDPAFLPVSRFLAQYRPVREPFSILHCDRDMPLHTVLAFRDHRDLDKINDAVEERAPLPWWQNGPHDRPCYLFGTRAWELRPTETALSKEGITLLFLDLSEKRRRLCGGVQCDAWRTAAAPPAMLIPERARGIVWRRAHGQCEKCGRHEGLDFYCLAPASLRGDPTPDDIQLLCTRCSPEHAS